MQNYSQKNYLVARYLKNKIILQSAEEDVFTVWQLDI